MKFTEFEKNFEYEGVDYNATQGHPIGEGYFYRCGMCGDVIPSTPVKSVSCSCENFFIDVDAARLGANNGDKSFGLIKARPR